MDKNKIVAHRGDNTNYPENTYIAIEAALNAGAKFVEFDIQMTADQDIIVFHDEDFKRMAGENLSVFEVTKQHLKTLSIHEPEQFNNKHYPTYASYLDEILVLLKHFPDATFLIEVKVKSVDKWGLEVVMKKLMSMLKEYTDKVIIISFSANVLEYVRTLSNIKIGFVFEQYTATIQKIANELVPEYMICPYTLLPATNWWKGSWEWMVYTINDVDTATEWLSKDEISYVETDDICLLLANTS